jgi:hypothetical protein
MVVIWSGSTARAVTSKKLETGPGVNKGGTIQHVTVALVLGIKRKGWTGHIGLADLVSSCLRLIPAFSFNHSILMVPELLGEPS